MGKTADHPKLPNDINREGRTELTAKELGISEELRQALIEVRGKLERGELSDDPKSGDDYFEMSSCSRCILGHAFRCVAKEVKLRASIYDWPEGLLGLYMGYDKERSVARAAVVLAHYLRTGDGDCWRNA
jgi:hypothetical protein